MLAFYRKALVAFLTLLVLTAAVLYGGFLQSRLSASLFPAKDPALPWAPAIEPTSPTGDTWLEVKSDVGTIDYEFVLDSEQLFPYTHYSFYFIQPDLAYRLVDLTDYDHLSFRVLCDPRNVLLFVLFSFDEEVTDPFKPETRRVSSMAFSCNAHWQDVTIDFDELSTPYWWLDRYGFEVSETDYRLDKTMGLAFVNSLQSPMDQVSRVRITDVTLKGTEPGYLYAAAAITAAGWVLFIVWLIRLYVRALTTGLKEKVKLDQPLMAYKKLSIEPQRDKEKDALLRHMATEYANSELSLESTANTLGINRTKINEILREELGLTFTAYLKKLRLTEAARLLSEAGEANISEIAYLVGYNNVSYFNKLFKAEYGCTPKTFQTLKLHDSHDDDETP
ncbi:helix-turn-helix domain-containing protein [Marinimicrobium agarilyticum]|uniref:helix-turn-helix domain-containing protein n=1 Tax=Marinimicrobium agarilyticum TaxID=306546 RepID=UPI000684F717|nr:helix-turn-helix transcriptional regulator [Marinimicrobium agarilyticum]